MLRLFRRGLMRHERLSLPCRYAEQGEGVAVRLPDGFRGQDPRVRWGAYNEGLRAMQGRAGRQRAARRSSDQAVLAKFTIDGNGEFAGARNIGLAGDDDAFERIHHHLSGTNRPAAASITAPSENSVSS